MSYRLQYIVTVDWAPDAVGQVIEGNSSGSMTFVQQPGAPVPVIPGGNTLSAANLLIALNSMVTDINNQITTGTNQATPGLPTNLARLQAMSSGGA